MISRQAALRGLVCSWLALAGVVAFPPYLSEPTAQSGLDFAYYREQVEPIFTKVRGTYTPPNPGRPSCVMCHTWQTNTPLKLQSLTENAGKVYWTEEQSRRNFEVVSALVTPGDPDNSRLLRKPLSLKGGGVPTHVGGKFWETKDDPEWQTLAEWVRKAPRANPASPPEVDFEFFKSCVQPIFLRPRPGAIQCAECHSGQQGFVQTVPKSAEGWTDEESRRNFSVVSRFISPGHPTQSRFLMHPLHPNGGGDYAHNGVKRWESQKDPEWQMLAAWVRGERKGNSCQP